MKKKFCFIILLLASNISQSQLLTTDSIPVRISTLKGERQGGNNQLDWAVTCFLQYANFEIQRSSDGIQYTTIHSFQADELRCRQPFTYSDVPATDKSFYRIRVGDPDGRFYSSKTIVLYGQVAGFDLINITPTVATHEGLLNLASSAQGNVNILITSAAGIVIKKLQYNVQKGNSTIPLKTGDLPKGMYYVSVSNAQAVVRTGVFIKN